MSEHAERMARPHRRWFPTDWSAYRRAAIRTLPLAVAVVLIGVLFEAFGETAQIRTVSIFMINLMRIDEQESFKTIQNMNSGSELD